LASSLVPKNTKFKTCRTTILYVVLYGRETCSLTLTRGGALRMSDDRKLRKVSGGLRRTSNRGVGERRSEEFCHVSFSPNIIRIIKLRKRDGRGM
jgi:hypothetical protein